MGAGRTALRAVRRAARDQGDAERRPADEVAIARAEGHSWAAIGAMVSTSGQTARRRFAASSESGVDLDSRPVDRYPVGDGRVRSLLVEEHRNDIARTDAGSSPDCFEPHEMGHFTDVLALASIRRANVGWTQFDRGKRFVRCEVKCRHQFNLERIRNEAHGLVQRSPLGSEPPLDFRNGGFKAGGEIQRRETVGGIPPTTDRACSFSGHRGIARGQESKKTSLENGRLKAVNALYEFGIGQLEEDALCKRVDRTENLSVLAFSQERCRFLVSERRIGRKEPVVCRAWTKNAGEPIEDRQELEQALSCLSTWGRFRSQPPGHRSRARAQNRCDLCLVEVEFFRPVAETLQ